MCKSFNFFTNPCYFSFYFLINLLTIYPPHFPFVNHMFIVYVCESVSVLYIESFVLFLDSTDKWYHILFGFFCLTYFSKLNILLGPSMCCKWQYFILFYNWVIPILCIYHIFLSQVSIDGHLGCFHVLAILSSAAVNIGIYISFQIRVFVFPDIYPGVGLLDHMAALFLVFKETHCSFP